MDQARAFSEYHRCLTELEARGADVRQEDWIRCVRPGWIRPIHRWRWHLRLYEMRRRLR